MASKDRKKKRKRSKSACSSSETTPIIQNGSNSITSSDAEATTTPAIEATFSSASSLSSKAVSPPTLLAGRKFLTSQDPGFARYVQDHYPGFVHLPVDRYEGQYPQQHNFHGSARQALERLRDANYYQYDIVMAGGKHSSRTFVKRTLVGEPGITYKYLGVRLFAHAWSGPSASPSMKAIGEMNQRMIQMTKQVSSKHGMCNYNLTLINYMEPTSHTSVGFKEEANYGMGKVSVSWHADSSLERGSSIGVYHCFPTQRAARWDWRIALRPSPDSSSANNDTAVLPVAVNTKDGDLYFLLEDFNENNQHCVLAGSQANRISSTHRVAVTAEDTYDYILKRVKIARKRFRLQMEGNTTEGISETTTMSPPLTELDAKIIRYCQRVLTEVEMEWIAQYWLQGAEHDKMHVWWQRPMKTLEAYFGALEEYNRQLYQVCTNEDTSRLIPLDVLKVLLTEFKLRQSLRQQWDERRADKIYQRRIVPEYRPVARPIFSSSEGERLSKDLAVAIQQLSRILKARSRSLTEKGHTSVSAKSTLPSSAVSNQQGSSKKKKKKQLG